MAAGPRLLVPPPARTPTPFGLWATVQNPAEPDVHWANGVGIQPDACDESDVTTDPCPTPPASKAATTDGLESKCSEPFTVYSWVDCGPIGLWGNDGDEFERRATAALIGGEARAVEREFWTGAAGTNPHLAATADSTDGECVLQTSADILVTGAGIGLARAVGELEDAIAECYGGVGVLHVPFKVIAPGFDLMQFVVRAGKLYTQAGTPVVASGAYPGTSPAGAAPAAGTAWLYATGAIVGYRGDVKITRPHESLNRSTNSEVVIAERTYTLVWECECHFAQLATL